MDHTCNEVFMLVCSTGPVGVANEILQAQAAPIEWDLPASRDQIADTVTQEGFEALTIAYNETSIGLQNPVTGSVQAVGAVTSLAGERMEGSGHKVSDANCFLAKLWSTMNHLVSM